MPIRVNTTNDCPVGSASAAPSAGARNGALHGVATTVASTPEKNEPATPCRACSLPPTAVARVPTSNTPDRFIANTRITTASTNTNGADCSWKPQPSCWPPARSSASTPASAQNDSSTPAVNASPCRLALRRLAPACSTKPTILMPSTGNTQGIRLRIRPPSSASIRMPGDSEVGAASPAAAPPAGASGLRSAVPISAAASAAGMKATSISWPR